MSKTNRILSIVFSILLVVCSGFLVFQIIRLNLLPTNFLIMAITIIVLIDAILIVIMNFYGKNMIAKVFMLLISVILSGSTVFGGFYLMKTANLFDTVTKDPNLVKQTVSVLVKAESPYEEIEDIQSKKLGTLNAVGSKATEALLNDLDKKDISTEQVGFEGISEMTTKLYDGEVDAVVLGESSIANIGEIEEFKDFDSKTRVIYKATFEVKNTNEANAVGSITEEPFNILITGSDSRNNLHENARSDVNMLVTVNPKTATVLLTSIPRDYYVTTQCDAEDACLVGQLDKITHTGVHGVNTTKKTVENLFGLDINYTFKVGFNSVEEIVDAIGGIDVTVEPELAVPQLLHAGGRGVTEGLNHMDGELALGYARERYAYEDGDRQRTRNQQQVLMAIVDKLTSPAIVTSYASLMDALQNTFVTNMSSSEIQSLVQYQLKSMPTWKFEQSMVDGTGSTEYCAELGQAAYVMIPDQKSVDLAKRKIDAVMDGKSSESVTDSNNSNVTE